MLLLCKLLEDCPLVLFKDWPRTNDLSCSSFPSSCRAVRPLLAVSGALPEPVRCSRSSATPSCGAAGSSLSAHLSARLHNSNLPDDVSPHTK